MTQLTIHCGIHKTATTSLQAALEQCKSILAKHNTIYLGPKDLRAQRLPQKEIIADAAFPANECQAVIISEENLIGTAREAFSNQRQLYRDAEKKISRLLDSIEACRGSRFDRISILIQLRNPSDLLSSIYWEYLRHNPFVEFEHFLKAVNFEMFSYYESLEPLASRLSRRGTVKIVSTSHRDVNGNIKDDLRLGTKEIIKLIFEHSGLQNPEGNSLVDTAVSKYIDNLSADPSATRMSLNKHCYNFLASLFNKIPAEYCVNIISSLTDELAAEIRSDGNDKLMIPMDAKPGLDEIYCDDLAKFRRIGILQNPCHSPYNYI